MPQRNAHISIIGDNELSREGLKRVLAEAHFSTRCIPLSDLSDHLDKLEDDPGHIVLVEIEHGDLAVNTSRLLRDHLKSARIVVLSASHDLLSAREALAMGVDGCLARQTSCRPLILMLELVALGERVLPRKVLDEFATAPSTVPFKRRDNMAPTHDLSRRELGILRCLVDGDPNKVIARKLGITEATVKIHVKAILRKLQVLNRTQAAIWVVDSGIFDRSEDIDDPEADGAAAVGEIEIPRIPPPQQLAHLAA